MFKVISYQEIDSESESQAVVGEIDEARSGVIQVLSISGNAERDQNFTESVCEEKMSLKSMEGSEFEEPTEENKTKGNKRETEEKKRETGKNGFWV